MSKLRKLAIIPDVHRPYHDKRAWALVARKVLPAWRPDILLVQGDFIDCAMISDHSKDPSRLVRFPEEVADANEGLDDLDALGCKEKYYTLGNHEHRLDRYLQTRAPELIGLEGFTIEDLLHLQDRGYTTATYRRSLKIGHMYATHDLGKAGDGAAKHARDRFEGNATIGHVHRINLHYGGNMRGKTRLGASFGWLGDRDSIDYTHRTAVLRDWTLGFGTGHVTMDGVVYLQAHPLVEYTCVVDGKLYVG